MTVIYRVTKIGSRLKYKLRHHKGYGVHSPFVFKLITDVIEEKHPYYAYSDINDYLNQHKLIDSEEKKHQLIFRIINRFNPQNIVILDKISDILCLYMGAVSKKINLHNLTNDIDAILAYNELEKNNDCFYFNFNKISDSTKMNIDCLLNNISPQSFIIIDKIRTNRQTETFWKMLVKNQKVQISLDLYHLGILFFDTKYYKQNYQLSF